MKILYFTWYENSKDDMEYALKAAGCDFKTVAYQIKNYDTDPELESFVKSQLETARYDAIFSFNYIPVLSNLALKVGLKYISWVYDSPHYTLYSNSITNNCNHIFLFDRNMVESVRSLGALHAYHMPLAVNTDRLNRQLDGTDSYQYDISFVGSLYEKSLFDDIAGMSEHMQGYLDAVMNIQHLIYGTNLVYSMLTPDKIEEFDKYMSINLGDGYFTDKSVIIGDIINKKITSYDRITAFNLLGAKYSTHIFTGSDTSSLQNVNCHGCISYMNEMPTIFRTSKINLNVTLRSITSGIPLRALDILGSGGFLLSNYQPELAEYFVDGIDLVMYEDDDDLINKAGYYLAHEEERKTIAINGHKKANQLFNYINVVKEILKSVN